MTSELFVTDQRMLQVMEWAIAGNAAGVKNQAEWCEKIGYDRLNLPKIKSGKLSFRKEYILRCAVVFGIDLNWMFGLSESMYRLESPEAPKLLERNDDPKPSYKPRKHWHTG